MAEDFELVIRGERVLTTAGIHAREVGIRDGRIASMRQLGAGLRGDAVIELAEDEVLIPGLVDTHVHVNEPGRTEWEGFDTATRAAAKGGVTTIVDMPLNSIPPTTTVEALQAKIAATDGKRHVNVGFWGGAVPGNLGELRALHEAGVFGFKCFLLHSGVPEFGHLEPDELEEYLRVLVEYDALMIVHAEDSRAIDRAPKVEGEIYEGFLRSRPRGAENLAIAEVIERARWTGARVHLLHLSSSDALPMIATARADGVKLTVETCPHYLTLASEDVPNGATSFKCCPPIREASNRDMLWHGLFDRTIDCIVSDHSPSTPDLKKLDTGDFGTAWGGIASLQLGLSVIWTAARARNVRLEQVVRWMSAKPAALAGMRHKGAIGVGYDADLAIFAPDEAFVVDVDKLEHRNPVSPYANRTLSGVVRRTLLAGQDIDFEKPSGALVWRGRA